MQQSIEKHSHIDTDCYSMRGWQRSIWGARLRAFPLLSSLSCDSVLVAGPLGCLVCLV